MLKVSLKLLHRLVVKSVTIATNMAGRGTDILLGGNPNFLTNNLVKNFLLTRGSKQK